MYTRKTAKDIQCPLEYGLQVFGGKWKSRIICAVFKNDKMRYTEFQRHLPDISDPVLSAMLKELINDELVERRQFEEIPPHTEYRLTGKGETVIPILHSICNWANEHQDPEIQASMRCQDCCITEEES